ncbi:MAG: valine--tRNA ligase [Oscillospiraceae bacterium]
MRELDKIYDPSIVEDSTYAYWQEKGYFNTKVDKNKKPYTIVMPPPNITGQLHMGHAMDETWQDILIRYKRMQGYAALWVPGTDHASIATEARIVAELAKEGVTKEDLGREGFLERAWDWNRQYGGRIVEQLKKLGSSCDWDRLRFTLDEGCSKAVRHVFKSLHDEGLIYRGERIINWCPHCLTSISDAEVEYEEQQGFFWHIRYPVKGSEEYLVLATTRPETMLGDTAVAVHPEDERYKHLIGKTVILPLVGREIPVVADEYVDREFGTGVVKITPAHDPNDFEVGRRHDLPIIRVMDDEAKINELGGKYKGLDRYDARKAIVDDLEAEGFLVEIEPHAHNVGTCYRCGTTVEPIVSMQWFVKMEPLAGPAVDAVKSSEIKFVPERFTKSYLHWMENTRDWCISRQLWWGHRIPAWYCADCGKTTVEEEEPKQCAHCGGTHLRQDEDTLDTWFSSALWPFSTLGWPEDTEDYKYFYPTSTLVTGYDIIGFWVSRMIFSGLHYTGKAPFNTVLVHGLVRDADGRKMSKSLGNGIDPLEVIETYGADALRFMLLTGSTPGNDMRFMEDKAKSARNFSNKLWNAARFVLMNLPEDFEAGLPAESELELSDKWALSLYRNLIKNVNENLNKYEFGLAAQKVYDFIWEVICDWTIEISKERLNSGNAATAGTAQKVLVYLLSGALKLLHPFMPFITEEIYRSLPGSGESIMIASWPEEQDVADYSAEEHRFAMVIDLIRALRTVRAEMGVHPAKRTNILIETEHPQYFEESEGVLKRLGFAETLSYTKRFEGDAAGQVQVSTTSARALIPMMELIDREKELARLEKEKSGADSEVELLSKRLDNKGFVDKAPEAVVQDIRDKLAKAQEKSERVAQSILALQ